MLWNRRWAIFVSIALAQLGIIFGYQAFLAGEQPAASPQVVAAAAAKEKEKASVFQVVDPAFAQTQEPLPLIPVPVAPLSAQPAPPTLPTPIQAAPPLFESAGSTLTLPGFPMADAMILPVSAKQEHLTPLPTQAPGQHPLVPMPPANPEMGGTPTLQEVPRPVSNIVPITHAAPAPRSLPTIAQPNGLGSFPPPLTEVKPEIKQSAQQPESKPATICPWSLNVEIVNGRTHLTAQNGEDVTFTISCEKLDVQTPGGVIHASGKVKIATDNIEGSCDRIVISWQDDVVLLDKAELRCKLDGHEADLNAEQMRVRLSRIITTTKMPPAFTFVGGFFR